MAFLSVIAGSTAEFETRVSNENAVEIVVTDDITLLRY